jgi:hypothetical protein
MKYVLLLSFVSISFFSLSQSQNERSFKLLQKRIQDNTKKITESFNYQRADEGDEFDEEMAVFFLRLGEMTFADYLSEIEVSASDKETVSVMLDLTSTMIDYFLLYPLLHNDPEEAMVQLIPLLEKIEQLTLKLDTLQGTE